MTCNGCDFRAWVSEVNRIGREGPFCDPNATLRVQSEMESGSFTRPNQQQPDLALELCTGLTANDSLAIRRRVTVKALLPAAFYWNDGNWFFNLYELIVVPTGEYDVNDSVNVGRNYWSFDTVFAMTNLNTTTGRDFLLITGYMINTENNDTDYRTGNELHVDAMFNQFLSETFALGVHGYYYQQVTGDSGSGAILGDFKGESFGIGPSFLWIPKSGGGKFSVTGTWLHDLHATDRVEGDYAVVTLAWQFGAAGS